MSTECLAVKEFSANRTVLSAQEVKISTAVWSKRLDGRDVGACLSPGFTFNKAFLMLFVYNAFPFFPATGVATDAFVAQINPYGFLIASEG
ncbi:MAG: hypothetical protein KJ995_00230 [Candidatus Omnitrophica bacterium]|nr:hypothetical protein [Candidatus Omnitrophota bacterium]